MLTHIVVLVGEYGMVSYSCTSSLYHYPWLDIVLWVDAMCLVRGNLVTSPGIKREEGL